jgi:hypothetical protein
VRRFLVVLVALATLAAPASAERRALPCPHVLLGAFVSTGLVNQWRPDALLAFEAKIGRPVAIDHHYRGWDEPSWPSSPRSAEQWDAAHGRIPMDSWHGPQRLDSILDGSRDTLIRAVALRVKAFRRPLFLRPMWEMNGSWEPWSGARNNSSGMTDGPAKFVGAWRHVHDVFAAVGATNAIWVWSPNFEDVPREAWNHWSSYYPGDAYVDWIAADGYNWGTTMSWSSWTSFASLFTPLYRDYGGRKPFMVAETSSVEEGGSKPLWIEEMALALKRDFPNVRALLWFEAVKSEGGRTLDWRVESSPASLLAFRTLAHDPYFSRTYP